MFIPSGVVEPFNCFVLLVFPSSPNLQGDISRSDEGSKMYPLLGWGAAVGQLPVPL